MFISIHRHFLVCIFITSSSIFVKVNYGIYTIRYFTSFKINSTLSIINLHCGTKCKITYCCFLIHLLFEFVLIVVYII